MQATLSSKGEVVIPSKVREALGLRPGQRLNMVQCGRSIVLSETASNLDAWLKARSQEGALREPLQVERPSTMPEAKEL